MLRFNYRMVPRKLKRSFGPCSGPGERIKRLKMLVTALVRHERIESTWSNCDESRGYAERLIDLAIRNGDTHKETMETADFWLLEKDLVHKLFKVLAPRYKNYSTSFTAMHRLPTEYPGKGQPLAILELNGNPWPPVLPRKRDNKYYLTNILLQEAKKDFYLAKQKKLGQSEDQTEKLVAAELDEEKVLGDFKNDLKSESEQLAEGMHKLNVETNDTLDSVESRKEELISSTLEVEKDISDSRTT